MMTTVQCFFIVLCHRDRLLFKFELQSLCLFTNYFAGILPCKVGRTTEKNVALYFREVCGNNLKTVTYTVSGFQNGSQRIGDTL